MNLSLPGKGVPIIGSLFSPPKAVALPPPPPPPPTPEDPSIALAKKKLEQSEKLRRGRAASVLTSGQGATDSAPLGRPSATEGSATLG